jgi:hypothetical protein
MGLFFVMWDLDLDLDLGLMADGKWTRPFLRSQGLHLKAHLGFGFVGLLGGVPRTISRLR